MANPRDSKIARMLEKYLANTLKPLPLSYLYKKSHQIYFKPK